MNTVSRVPLRSTRATQLTTQQLAFIGCKIKLLMVNKRNRKTYALMMLIVIGLGLGSRLYATHLPLFIASYAGDTLWALLVFLVVGFLFPIFPTMKVAFVALVFAFFIEVSQLYHAPWIDNIRHYRLAALVLGYTFLWSDLFCYSVGVVLGVVVEHKSVQGKPCRVGKWLYRLPTLNWHNRWASKKTLAHPT